MPTAHCVPRCGSKNCPPCLPPPWGRGIILTNDDNDDDASADGGHDNYNDATLEGRDEETTNDDCCGNIACASSCIEEGEW